MKMYTICFVEDEKDLSNLIKVYLEKAGYKVVTFNKGADAIDYIGQPAVSYTHLRAHET